jgi:phage tail-like protein
MPNPVSGVLNKGAEFLFGEVGMSHRFTFAVDKATYDLGTWSKVSGLTVSWETCHYQAGNSTTVWVGPGVPKYSNIRLSRAACSDSETVQEWLKDTLKTGKPLSGAVMMLDWVGTTIVEWKLDSFFPCAWTITEFDANSAKPAVETLDIAHTGFIQY